MFSKFYHKLKKPGRPRPGRSGRNAGVNSEPSERQPLAADIDQNLKALYSIFAKCSDVAFREIKTSSAEPVRTVLVYVEGMVDKSLVSEHILEALQLNSALIPQGRLIAGDKAFTIVVNHLVGAAKVDVTADMGELVDYVLAGSAALIIDGANRAIIASVPGYETRNVEEPSIEPVVRGPRDGFTENLRTNTSLIRRRIRTPRLKMETIKIGDLTRTEVAIAYIEGIAGDKVVEEAHRRLGRIKIDGILESGYLEELIEDQPFSVFPQINTTERPDKASACLLEGRVIILTDNTPMALIIPVAFPEFLQATEDYYNRYVYSTFIRILRFIALTAAVLLPSLYIAIVTFHQEMLPTALLISIASQREATPFPAFIEALFMESVFEILREAGVRLPRPIGQAVSIVGALVIGEAAVNAGLVSPAMVMVVSLTAISSFTMPTLSGSYAIRMLRFPMMFLAASFGLFGIMVGLMGILFHLCSLRSFGVPYLSPLAPTSFRDMKDMVVRAPWWAMINRPSLVGFKDLRRQESGQRPGAHRQVEQKKIPGKPRKGGDEGAGRR